MKANLSYLNAKACEESLSRFWSEQLRVKEADGGLLVALPLLYPNGVQVVLTIKEVSQTDAILSDNGEVISALNGYGIDIGSKSVTRELLEERVSAFEIQRFGMELQKGIKLPLDGIDIHLFGEALVSISHLIYRHEVDSARSQHVYYSIRNLLLNNDISFKEKEDANISGKIEKSIRVDFLTGNGSPKLACKTIERRGRMRDYMEQWGYRWTDAKEQHPHLIRAMFYDPENQKWDDETLNIGRSVCEVFEPYFESERISQAFSRYGK
jgi:hypothetical protein